MRLLFSMTYYTSRQIREILGLSPSIVTRLVGAGFVAPARGPRREYRFSFQDLVVLRAAKGLADARLPARRISRALKKLREQLPADLPAAGLRIAAVGNAVAVMQGRDAWRAEDGQYLLALEVKAPQGQVVILERSEEAAAQSAESWFEKGCELEESDAVRAIDHYRKALAASVCHSGIYTNLGRLLHEKGQRADAQSVYEEGTRVCPDDALLHFNLGVLLDEQSRTDEAIACYVRALEKDPRLVDAHYNLALAYERTGRQREALRHFNACRKLGKT
jgi:tetratricopeptide (TPR) repeat protein